jgi:hypothetical protein
MVKSILKKKEETIPSQKTVCFSDLEIYTFENILGDNPGCSQGSPLSISWEHSHKQIVQVDMYEYCRGPRRSRKALAISGGKRDA